MRDIVFDLEIFSNWFLASFMDVKTKKVLHLEVLDRLSKTQSDQIKKIIWNDHMIGYNSLRFDTPILMEALKGAPVGRLYQIAQAIISNDLGRPYDWNEHQAFLKPIRHQDLFPFIFPRASLKLVGARIYTKNIIELPKDPHSPVNLRNGETETLKKYCENDLKITAELYARMRNEVDTRENLGRIYGMDVKSLSEARICENIIVQTTGIPRSRGINTDVDARWKYVPPEGLEFENRFLRRHMEKNFLRGFQVGRQ